MTQSNQDFIRSKYQVINSFPFVIGVLYYTEIQKEEEEKQTRFIHALDQKKFSMETEKKDRINQIIDRSLSVFFPLHEVFVEGDTLYQVYQPLRGNLLIHHIKQQGPLPLEEVYQWGQQVVNHLLSLYEEGEFTIVHPQNMIIHRENEVRFLYGGPSGLLPKGLMSMAQGDTEMLYDSYSLGALLYQMMTGKFPMAGGVKVQPIREHNPNCPVEVETFILRALSLDMNKRPHIQEFQQALKKWI